MNGPELKSYIDSLDSLCQRLQSGEEVNQFEILPFLTVPVKPIRAYANLKLAASYFQLRDMNRARDFIDRAWDLSNRNPEFIEAYATVHLHLGNTGPVALATKDVGFQLLSQGKRAEALRMFDRSLRTALMYTKADKFFYDPDIVEAVLLMARDHRFETSVRPGCGGEVPVRVGLLLAGTCTVNSALIRHNLTIATHIDRSKFDLSVIVPEPEEHLRLFPHAYEVLEEFRKLGCRVLIGPKHDDEYERHLELARMIHTAEFDILVTNEQIPPAGTLFITATRPAPIIVGLNHGHPSAFTSSVLDWSIAWTAQGVAGSHCNATFVKAALPLPEGPVKKPYTKRELGIGDDEFVLLSSGRATKYQTREYWCSIFELLREVPRSRFLLIGVELAELPFLSEWAEFLEKSEKIQFLGWRGDSSRFLGAADLYLDSFPNGGGFSMYEAMSLGLPCVSFENDYLRLFDQDDWSPAYEYFQIPELMAPRHDFAAFKKIVSQLYNDVEQRARLGRLSEQLVRRHLGDKEGMVRAVEKVLLDSLIRKTQREPSFSFSAQS